MKIGMIAAAETTGGAIGIVAVIEKTEGRRSTTRAAGGTVTSGMIDPRAGLHLLDQTAAETTEETVTVTRTLAEIGTAGTAIEEITAVPETQTRSVGIETGRRTIIEMDRVQAQTNTPRT